MTTSAFKHTNLKTFHTVCVSHVAWWLCNCVSKCLALEHFQELIYEK